MNHPIFRDLLPLPPPPRDEPRYSRHYGNREASARAFASYGRHAQRATGQPPCPAGACC